MASSRQALTFQEKDSVRIYKQQHPEATQHQCRLWFLKTYNKKITQSTISEILSKSFTTDKYYQNERNKNSVVVRNPSRQRKTSSKYSELDTPLYMAAIEMRESGTQLTFPLLQQLAIKLWPVIYGPHTPIPHISVGMMQRFADRNALKITRIRNISKAKKAKSTQIKLEEQESQPKQQPLDLPTTPLLFPQPELLLQQQVSTQTALNVFNSQHQPQNQISHYIYSENVPDYSLPSVNEPPQWENNSVDYPDSPCSSVTDNLSCYSPPLLSSQVFNPYLQYNTMASVPFQNITMYDQTHLSNTVKPLLPASDIMYTGAPQHLQDPNYIYYDTDPSLGVYFINKLNG
jgi:hypothetical protein